MSLKILSITALVLGLISILTAAFSISNYMSLQDDMRSFRSEQLYDQALIDINQRNFELAQNKLKEALNYNPNLKNANFQLAFISVANDEKSAAIVFAEKELEIYPDSANTLSLLGTVQIMEEDMVSAEKNLKKAIEIEGTNRDAVLNLSHLYRGREQASKASEILEQFLAVRPKDSMAQFKYQMALIAGGRQSRIVNALQLRINSEVATGPDYILATAIQLYNGDTKQAYTALNESLKKSNSQEILALLQDPFFKDYSEVINQFSAYQKQVLEQAKANNSKKD
jgi:Tfp pilus assembly protein PilF